MYLSFAKVCLLLFQRRQDKDRGRSNERERETPAGPGDSARRAQHAAAAPAWGPRARVPGRHRGGHARGPRRAEEV